jgi:hypothetical protein
MFFNIYFSLVSSPNKLLNRWMLTVGMDGTSVRTINGAHNYVEGRYLDLCCRIMVYEGLATD